MKWHDIFLIALFLGVSILSMAQSPRPTVAEELIESAAIYADNYPHEKVYLHFDNNSYYLGDTLWYKAYLMTNGTSRMSISKVLHVELWSQFGQKADEQLLPIKDGVACGQFHLKKRMLPGYYEVRAYTRWMRNWGDLHYFSRVFPFYAAPMVAGEYKKELFNFRLDRSVKTRPQTDSKKFEISFFPEGGNLVKGIFSKVAFRVRAKNDPFPDAKLEIYSNDDVLLDTYSVIHDGMGWFRYRPTEKPGYVKVYSQGKAYTFELPDCKLAGICLSVSPPVTDSVSVCLQRDSELRTDTLAVCIVACNRPYQAANVVTNDKEVTLKFPLSELPAGVSQVLLLSSRGKILCERMFFVNRPAKYVNITATRSSAVYLPGEKVKLKLKVFGNDNQPVSTDLSLAVRSVVDCDLQRQIDNARTNLLLSSELRGYIHRPEYYFLSDGGVRSMELDLLLAVQGWKRYNWESSDAFSQPVFSPEMDLQLDGRLKSRWTRRFLPNAEVSIMIRDSILAMGSVRTDSSGFFSIPLPDITGRQELILQSRSGKMKNRKKQCYFLLDRHFAPPLRAYAQDELLFAWDCISASDSLAMIDAEHLEQKSRDGIRLDEVFVKGKKRMIPFVEYDRSVAAIYNVEEKVEEDLDKGKRYVSLYEFLREQTVLMKRVNDSISYNNKYIIPIVNGRAVMNPYFQRQVFSEVENIRSVMFCEGSSKDKYLMQAFSDRESIGTDWDIEINSRPEDPKSEVTTFDHLKFSGKTALMIVEAEPQFDYHLRHKSSRGLRATYIQGYAEPEAFYSPDYSKTEIPLPADFRRTLYWNPNLHTDVNGELDIEFYNAQQYTLLNVNAETVTTDGRIGIYNR